MWLGVRYRRALQHSLDRPQIVYVLSACAAVAVVLLGINVAREFLPDLDEGAIRIHVTMPAGISLAKATEMAADLRKVVREFPEVDHIVTELGRNDEGLDPWTPSHIEGDILLQPPSAWPNGGRRAMWSAGMAERFRDLPGYDIHVSQPIIESVDDRVFDVHSQLVVRIFGDDFNEMRRIGNDIIKVLKTVPGTEDVAFDIDQQPPLPQIAINVDRAAPRATESMWRISADLIRDRHRRRCSESGLHRRAPLRHDACVSRERPQQHGGDRSTCCSRRATAPSSRSPRSPIQLQLGESTITRWINKRSMTVKLNYRDRDLSSLMAEAKAAIANKVSFDPRKYRIEWGWRLPEPAAGGGAVQDRSSASSSD